MPSTPDEPPFDSTPNPGSDEAIAKGCTCPVMDNNHGKWEPWTGGWWITEGCPLHAGLVNWEQRN